MPRTTHKLAWTERAVRDLETISRFIAHEAPMNDRRAFERLETRAGDLARLPERGRIVPELARFGIVEYRGVIVRPYRIIYRVRGRNVYVIAVIDGRRDTEDLLFERLACSPAESPPYDLVTKRSPRKKK